LRWKTLPNDLSLHWWGWHISKYIVGRVRMNQAARALWRVHPHHFAIFFGEIGEKHMNIANHGARLLACQEGEQYNLHVFPRLEP
jgi:hypothetical protein